VNLEVGFDPNFVALGPLVLGWHGLFTALAVALAVWLALRRAAAYGLPTDKVGDLAVWSVLGGMVGARIFHVLDHWDQYAARPLEIFAVWQGGIAVYGAFIGGVVTGLFLCQRMGLPKWTMLDVAAPAMLVGQAIGRLGCLSNGDAWGGPCDGAGVLCLIYSHPNALLPNDLRGVPTHPYPLYEMIAVGFTLAVIWFARRRLTAPGLIFVVAGLGYAITRFTLTVYRQEAQMAFGLQEAQLIAIATALLILGGRFLLFRPRA